MGVGCGSSGPFGAAGVGATAGGGSFSNKIAGSSTTRAAGGFVLTELGISAVGKGRGATFEVGVGVDGWGGLGGKLGASDGTGTAVESNVALEDFLRVALGLNSAVGGALFFLALGAGRLVMGPGSGEGMEDLMGAVSFGGVGLTFTVEVGLVVLEAWVDALVVIGLA